MMPHRAPNAYFRIGNVLAIKDVLAELNVDPPTTLAKVGLSEILFQDAEALVPVRAIDELAVVMERTTGCDHVGFLVGRRPADLGLPGFLLRNAPTLRAGIADFIKVTNLSNRAGGMHWEEYDDDVKIGYAPVVAELKAARHLADCAIAQIYGILRAAMGPGFRPMLIQLPRRAPTDARPYSVHFGLLPRFESVEASISFDSRFLDRPPIGADPALYAYLKKLAPSQAKLTAIVLRLLPAMILQGPISTKTVAGALNLPPRTLCRRLSAEGTSPKLLIATVRGELARQLVEDTNLAFIEIAHQLGYPDASAFTRHFRKLNKISPVLWRRASIARTSSVPSQ